MYLNARLSKLSLQLTRRLWLYQGSYTALVSSLLALIGRMLLKMYQEIHEFTYVLEHLIIHFYIK